MEPRNMAAGRWEAASTCSVTMGDTLSHRGAPKGPRGHFQPLLQSQDPAHPLAKGLLDNMRLAKGRDTKVTMSFARPCQPPWGPPVSLM